MALRTTWPSLIRRVYLTYGRRGLLHRMYQPLLTSRLVARWYFGVNLSHLPRQGHLYDLTTILLRQVLRPRIKPPMNVLEIGVGRSATLSLSLSKSCDVPIDGLEISPECVQSASDCVVRNKGRVFISQSDVFQNASPKEYGLIFWNLPYLGPMWGVNSGYDRTSYLHPLFKDAPKYLSKDGELVLGFNGRAITVEDVVKILRGYGSLALKEVKSWWWNDHAILIISRT